MWFVSLPVQLAMFTGRRPVMGPWLGVAVWLVGLFFETVGDRQLPGSATTPAQGQGARHRAVALHAAPELLRRRDGVDGALPRRRGRRPGVFTILSPVSWCGTLAGTGKQLLEKDMAPATGVRRLRATHERLLPVAAEVPREGLRREGWR